MHTSQRHSAPRASQLTWCFSDPAAQNLSLALEKQARYMRSSIALALPGFDGEFATKGERSVDFGRLVLEQNAWINYFVNKGVSRGDAAIVSIPYGTAFVAISYALFRIGVDVCILDPEFDWSVGAYFVKDYDAQHFVGTRQSSVLARRAGLAVSDAINYIEVGEQQSLIGSALRSFRVRLTGCDPNEASLTVLRTHGSNCSRSTFQQRQLCSLANCFLDWFSLSEGDLALAGSVLESLLFPAAGLCSLLVSDRFSDGSPVVAKVILEVIQQRELKAVSGESRLWKSLARWSCDGDRFVKVGFVAIVRESRMDEVRSQEMIAKFPAANFHLVFGSPSFPFLSSRAIEADRAPVLEAGFRGNYIGVPFPGVQVSLLPVPSLRWPEEVDAVSSVGELAIAREDYAPIGDQDYWEGTGELVFFDASGGLWNCGSRSDIVNTSYGGFCPVRCESVFDRHPRVIKTVLVGLRRGDKTRPGLIVQTALENLPKRGIEESRFKAELMQLAADIEETSLILDIFFSDRLPLEEGGLQSIDRNRLAKKYSRSLRF